MAKTLCSLAVVAMGLIGAPAANAAIYAFDRSFGAQGHTFGYFEIDKAFGALTRSNILNMSISYQHPDVNGGAVQTVNDLNFSLWPGDLLVNGSELIFNFWGNSTITTYGEPFWFLFGRFGRSGFSGSWGVFVLDDYGTAQVVDSSFVGSLGTVAYLQVPQTVPLPAGLPMLVTALAGLGLAGWRRRKQ